MLKAIFVDFGPIRIFSLPVPRSFVVFFVGELPNGLSLRLQSFRIFSRSDIGMSTMMGGFAIFWCR